MSICTCVWTSCKSEQHAPVPCSKYGVVEVAQCPAVECSRSAAGRYIWPRCSLMCVGGARDMDDSSGGGRGTADGCGVDDRWKWKERRSCAQGYVEREWEWSSCWERQFCNELVAIIRSGPAACRIDWGGSSVLKLPFPEFPARLGPVLLELFHKDSS